MTERLRDIVATDDPALAELARLVRASGDPEPRPGAQDRVWRALVDRSTARPQQRWQIAVVAVLVLVVVLPAAIAGVRWIVATPVSPSIPSPVPPRVPSPAPSPATPGSPHPARSGAAADPAPVAPAVADAPVALPAVPATPARPIGDGEVARGASTDAPASAESVGSVPVPAPAPEAPPAGERRPHLPGRTTAPVRDVPTAGGAAVRVRESSRLPMDRRAASGPDAADTGLVVDAMRRLRRGHDPRAALRQLDAYLARFPDGDLAEEALALAIEARAALGDATACSLAEQYVQRYPHGPLREPIERIRLQLRDPASQRCPDGPAPQPR